MKPSPQTEVVMADNDRSEAHQELPGPLPLTLKPGTPAQIARLRLFLKEIGYTESAICQREHIAGLHIFKPSKDREIRDALDLAMTLFLEGKPVARELVTSRLPNGGPALLEDFGLIEPDADDPSLCRATLGLYPLRGLYLISDLTRVVAPPGDEEPADDVVFPATTGTTYEWLSCLPTTPCENLLDIGAGTGVGALLGAAGYAGHAWALDITERATRMCEFNARLNGIENVTILTGDLYEPVKGKTFDRIISHPPYVPKPESRIIYRDGGADGEDVLRRVLRELPEYLQPGGLFCCRCMASDRKDAPLEQRLREMIGPEHTAFDVAVITNVCVPPGPFYCRMVTTGAMGVMAFGQQLQLFHDLGVENVVVGFIYIERHKVRQDPITVRRQLASRTTPFPPSVKWLFDWERAASYPELPLRLIDARPIASTDAEIMLNHRMREGELWLEGCRIATSFPFAFAHEAPPGMGLLIGACDGTHTTAELYEQMKELQAWSPDSPIENFVDLIRQLVGGGVLELEDFRLPRPDPTPPRVVAQA
jgi:carbamoyltransferase